LTNWPSTQQVQMSLKNCATWVIYLSGNVLTPKVGQDRVSNRPTCTLYRPRHLHALNFLTVFLCCTTLHKHSRSLRYINLRYWI